MTLHEVLQRFPTAHRNGSGYKALCPAHEDKSASLQISQGEKGVLIHCHAGCELENVLAAVGLTTKDLFISKPPKPPDGVRIWEIRDVAGKSWATHGRRDLPNGEKKFWWTRNGKKNLDGAKTKDSPLYNSQALPYYDKTAPTYLCEGEKDTDSLLSLEVQAVGTTTGSEVTPSREVLSTLHNFSDLRLWPDNDPGGQKHMQRIATALRPLGCSASFVNPGELPKGGGATDWIDRERKAGLELVAQLREALATLPRDYAFGEDVAAGTPGRKPKAEREDSPSPSTQGYHPSDLGNAERFVALHGASVRYCASRGWMVWDGKRWAQDITGAVYRLAVDTVRSIYREVADTEDKKEREALAAHAMRSEGERRIKAIISLASFAEGIAVNGSDFDKTPWLLNVDNGTLDLRTGALRPHRREDLITCLSPVSYFAGATCPTWERFLHRAMRGNPALLSFLQRAAGYSLTAQTGEEVFFLCWGEGRNGKSKFLQGLRETFGEDYAKTSNFRTFEESLGERANTPRGDLVSLRGKRLVTAIESKEGKRLAEEVIKSITGNDPITARQLHREEETFLPSFKLWLASNNKPIIKGLDVAIWERVLLIPWTVYIPPAERDLSLIDKFRAELPGILSWAVRGCLAWQKERLSPPEEVKAAVQAYREEMDELRDFLLVCCVLGKEMYVYAGDLYGAYLNFCETHGAKPMSLQMFGKRLASRGLEKSSYGGKLRYTGIGLLSKNTPKLAEA